MFLAESTVNTNVTSNVNSSQTSTGGSSSHTSITTTTNGETTHIESNEQGSIHVETINGETTVKTSPGMKVEVKKGEAKVEDNLKPTPKASSSPEVKGVATINTEDVKSETKEVKQNILEQIKEMFENFFKKLQFPS